MLLTNQKLYKKWTIYLNATSFSHHIIVPFTISFIFETPSFGNSSLTDVFFTRVTATMQFLGVIGDSWNAIPTTPHTTHFACKVQEVNFHFWS